MVVVMMMVVMGGSVRHDDYIVSLCSGRSQARLPKDNKLEAFSYMGVFVAAMESWMLFLTICWIKGIPGGYGCLILANELLEGLS